MSTLNVVLTHLPAEAVDHQLAALTHISPSSRFVVCHGGRREDCEAVSRAEAAFIVDPTLRGAPRSLQSYDEIFATVHDRWVAPADDVDAVYFFEFDHIVLRPGFEASLSDVAATMRADFLGKHCVVRNGSNWEHYGRFRRDPVLLAHLRRVSVREDPTVMYGTLGDGMWLTRDALAAYVGVSEHPPCYGELYVPTLLHHLGFRVADIDQASDLYDHVRWIPPYSALEVETLADSGATFAHPVKDRGVWQRIADRVSGAP